LGAIAQALEVLMPCQERLDQPIVGFDYAVFNFADNGTHREGY
jgi:hypothetical protein